MDSIKSKIFPVTRSILSTQMIISDVLSNYDLDTILDCKFLHFGLNDTYLVMIKSGMRYILRVYRLNWRSFSEISYELDVLNHIDKKGLPIAKPIAQKSGNFIQTVQSPEGIRYVVLFSYAPGKNASYEKESELNSFTYGSAVASIHNATQDFYSHNSRFQIDLNTLIDLPLKCIAPQLEHRKEDFVSLNKLGDKIREKLDLLPLESLEKGFCHGDFHRGNCHIDNNKTVTFYDFDCCGFGWRAYDIAVFRWGARLIKKEKELWEPFIRGYREQRDISDFEENASRLFIGIRHIWLLGLHAGNGNDFGYGFMDDAYFDRAFAFLKDWEIECLPEIQ